MPYGLGFIVPKGIYIFFKIICSGKWKVIEVTTQNRNKLMNHKILYLFFFFIGSLLFPLFFYDKNIAKQYASTNETSIFSIINYSNS